MKRKKKLTERERKIIQKYYGKEGYAIKKRLPGRSQALIRYTALMMGLSSPNDYERALWSKEELDLAVGGTYGNQRHIQTL